MAGWLTKSSCDAFVKLRFLATLQNTFRRKSLITYLPPIIIPLPEVLIHGPKKEPLDTTDQPREKQALPYETTRPVLPVPSPPFFFPEVLHPSPHSVFPRRHSWRVPIVPASRKYCSAQELTGPDTMLQPSPYFQSAPPRKHIRPTLYDMPYHPNQTKEKAHKHSMHPHPSLGPTRPVPQPMKNLEYPHPATGNLARPLGQERAKDAPDGQTSLHVPSLPSGLGTIRPPISHVPKVSVPQLYPYS